MLCSAHRMCHLLVLCNPLQAVPLHHSLSFLGTRRKPPIFLFIGSYILQQKWIPPFSIFISSLLHSCPAERPIFHFFCFLFISSSSHSSSSRFVLWCSVLFNPPLLQVVNHHLRRDRSSPSKPQFTVEVKSPSSTQPSPSSKLHRSGGEPRLASSPSKPRSPISPGTSAFAEHFSPGVFNVTRRPSLSCRRRLLFVGFPLL
jgi:hypothetical protein